MDDRLNQALRTLRAIRQRYETGRDAGSGCMRSYTVQVGLGYADMLWIAAAIEALERATTASGNEQPTAENTRVLGGDSLPLETASALRPLLPGRQSFRTSSSESGSVPHIPQTQ